MNGNEHRADLLRSMGKMVRGLSALFWGLPLTLVIYVQTATTDWLDPLEWWAMAPPALITGLLLFGLIQMHSFQKQERIWIRALDRAEILAFINIGLSPFIYWWHRLPGVTVYTVAIALIVLSSIIFVFNLNHVLERLTAMLPDEALRLETKMFTSFNRTLLVAIPILIVAYFILAQFEYASDFIGQILDTVKRVGLWFMIFLLLMPLAMTMTLIWKIKEVIFNSIFQTND
ncbi:MAG: hypothetical protein JWM68_3246 [Verrucomicrobiales bacterium]|nr:hypothetical protein [Verrucomicrobiales bacterium]